MENSYIKCYYIDIFQVKYEISILLFSVLVLSTVTFALPSYASGNDPYDSGYDHGCDDAGISDSSDRYINQPEKGPSFHTNAFMNGYYDGFNACSNNTSDSDNNNGNNGNPRSEGQTENRGLLGNYADGHRAGLADGADDYRNGRSAFARCPGGSLDYCAGYNFGYNEGYDAARKVG